MLCFDLLYKKKKIGSVDLICDGLYYILSCSCRIADNGIYKIRGWCGSESINLGVLIPVDGELRITRRIPVKHLWGDKTQFEIYLDDDMHSSDILVLDREGIQVPIDSLRTAQYCTSSGQAGLLFGCD